MTVRRSTATTKGWGPPVLLAFLVVTGCLGGELPPDVPRHRPSDGLLGDPELQAVVELQVRRDGPGIVAFLGAERAAVRARAAFALASVQDVAAVPALVAALGDPDAGVRRDAAFALGQARRPEAVEPLAAAFAVEAEKEVRTRILEALGKLPSLNAATTLTGLVTREDEEADLTLAIARLGAVGGMATEQSQAFLLARLDHENAQVRTASAYYFGRLAAADPWAAHAPRVRQALDAYGRTAPEAMYLVQALGKLADPQDGARLRGWLEAGADWRIRANAAAALGSLPPEPANRDVLFDALDDVSPLVSDQAAQALAVGDALPSDLPRLETWIASHPDRRPAVAPLLSLLARADSREFVFEWLDALDLDDVVGWSAGLPALGVMPGQEAVDRLVRAAGSEDPRVKGPAMGALVRRWGQDRLLETNHALYFRVFSEALASGNVQAATRAAGVLADPMFIPLGSVGVLEKALRGMEDPKDLEAMIAVIEALGGSGSPDALPVVQEALGHATPAIRQAAAEALLALGGEPPPAGREEAVQPPVHAPSLDWEALAALGAAPRWILETDLGTVIVQFAPEEAPLTVQTLVRLSLEGKYDGVLFHRVVPNFVAQGGDFASGDGFGGPGFTITSEFTQVPYLRGSAGMASAGKDTEGSQFFFTHSIQPHLDGGYTSFGWIISGMEVVDRLDVGNRILRATVERGD